MKGPQVNRQILEVSDSFLETVLLEVEGATDTIVLLHEALGCIELWKEFPMMLAEHLKMNVLLYSRKGHGRSSPFTSKRDNTYLHHEGINVLPEVLKIHSLARPILVGHSDGGSIALIFAGSFPDIPKAVIAVAPHLFVEQLTLSGINRVVSNYSDKLQERLGRYHNDARAVFSAWKDVWLDPEFQDWNIENLVSRIRCPVLAIQGVDDQYGTLNQIERIKELAPQANLSILTDCGHSPQVERTEELLDICSKFLLK